MERKYTLRDWLNDMDSKQFNRRNKAFSFMREHGLEPSEVGWNALAVKWVDGVVYVVGRNVKRDGDFGARYEIHTAERYLEQLPSWGYEGVIDRLNSYINK